MHPRYCVVDVFQRELVCNKFVQLQASLLIEIYSQRNVVSRPRSPIQTSHQGLLSRRKFVRRQQHLRVNRINPYGHQLAVDAK